MRRLALLCLLAPIFAVVLAAPAEATVFDCYTDTHIAHTYRDQNEGAQRYDWSLRILNQHCVSPTTYFDDILELRVRGELDRGHPQCNGEVLGGWAKYTANVGRLAPRDPAEVEWNCTSAHSWQFTWDYPANDNLYLGAGDRCVGAHVRWVRPNWPDSSMDLNQVCF